MRFKNGGSCVEEIPDTLIPKENTKSFLISHPNWELLSSNTFTQESKDIVWEVIVRSWKKRDIDK